jgi:hypothetical protein
MIFVRNRFPLSGLCFSAASDTYAFDARDKSHSFPPFSADDDTGGRRRLVGHEERAGKRLARHGAILLEIGDALAREKRIVDQEMPGETA